MEETHLYLTLIPEALVASHLPPEEFGSYMAVGEKFYSREEAIFFELEPDFVSDEFPMELAQQRCRPHADGSPKKSVYLSTYRVLERIPIEHLGTLYLTTDDGRVLGLARSDYTENEESRLHLYQEFCPVTPRVASRLSPLEFVREMASPDCPVGFRRILFADLILGELAKDPLAGEIGELPYRELSHLRTCLQSLVDDRSKATKNISRRLFGHVHYRTIRNGFFVGDVDGFAFYPMPSREQLEDEHRNWWRSAQTVSA